MGNFIKNRYFINFIIPFNSFFGFKYYEIEHKVNYLAIIIKFFINIVEIIFILK